MGEGRAVGVRDQSSFYFPYLVDVNGFTDRGTYFQAVVASHEEKVFPGTRIYLRFPNGTETTVTYEGRSQGTLYLDEGETWLRRWLGISKERAQDPHSHLFGASRFRATRKFQHGHLSERDDARQRQLFSLLEGPLRKPFRKLFGINNDHRYVLTDAIAKTLIRAYPRQVDLWERWEVVPTNVAEALRGKEFIHPEDGADLAVRMEHLFAYHHEVSGPLDSQQTRIRVASKLIPPFMVEALLARYRDESWAGVSEEEQALRKKLTPTLVRSFIEHGMFDPDRLIEERLGRSLWLMTSFDPLFMATGMGVYQNLSLHQREHVDQLLSGLRLTPGDVPHLQQGEDAVALFLERFIRIAAHTQWIWEAQLTSAYSFFRTLHPDAAKRVSTAFSAFQPAAEELKFLMLRYDDFRANMSRVVRYVGTPELDLSRSMAAPLRRMIERLRFLSEQSR